jgi:hypothetical protein
VMINRCGLEEGVGESWDGTRSIPSGVRGRTGVAALRCLQLDLSFRFWGIGPRWVRRQSVRRPLPQLILALRGRCETSLGQLLKGESRRQKSP